jgi:hypothetical protein
LGIANVGQRSSRIAIPGVFAVEMVFESRPYQAEESTDFFAPLAHLMHYGVAVELRIVDLVHCFVDLFAGNALHCFFHRFVDKDPKSHVISPDSLLSSGLARLDSVVTIVVIPGNMALPNLQRVAQLVGRLSANPGSI